MPSGYQIDKQDGAYFLTSTVVGWVDLFIRDNYKQFIAENLNYCIENFGLQIYAYVIMPSHMHMIASAKNENLSNLIGNFKKFTSRELIKKISCEGFSLNYKITDCFEGFPKSFVFELCDFQSTI
jgi:REP element-mobilizing transposase RayT